jgi:hypothetical protein
MERLSYRGMSLCLPPQPLCNFRTSRPIFMRLYLLCGAGHYLKRWMSLSLSKKVLLAYETRRFITVLTKARHWTLSWASWIQFAPSIPISLMLSSHLRLGLPSGLLPSGLPTKTQQTPPPSPMRATWSCALNSLLQIIPALRMWVLPNSASSQLCICNKCTSRSVRGVKSQRKRLKIRGCILKFPDWPPGSENCNWYSSPPLGAVVSPFCEFCRHNPLCCFSTSVYCYLFRYRLSPETFGYTLLTRTVTQRGTIPQYIFTACCLIKVDIRFHGMVRNHRDFTCTKGKLWFTFCAKNLPK